MSLTTLTPALVSARCRAHSATLRNGASNPGLTATWNTEIDRISLWWSYRNFRRCSWNRRLTSLDYPTYARLRSNVSATAEPTVATVAWLGYEAPQTASVWRRSPSVATDEAASRGAVRLESFSDGLDAARKAPRT